MKKIITAVLTLALLAALTGASASEAGTTSDPLVTQSYIDTTYTQAVVAKGMEAIEAALAGLTGTLDALTGESGRVLTTRGREVFMNAGSEDTVTLGFGGSFILLSGEASVTFASGEVIDTSTGLAAASGSSLAPLTRYFVTEDTLAAFAPSADALFVLDGPYSAGPGIHRQYGLYEDVEGGEWYYDAAVFSHDRRLYLDWDAPLFRGEEDATRAEMVYALWVCAGSPETDAVSPFTDLTEEWYVPAVNWAYEHGVTNGNGTATLFDPEGLLSRQQLITMLFRWFGDRGLDVSARSDLTVFPDYEDIESWAVDSSSWAAAVGIILGYEDDTFRPLSNIIRAEAATVLQRSEPLSEELAASPDEAPDPAASTDPIPTETVEAVG